MDFVPDRVIEKFLGWRAIITPVIRALGVTILDPWNKPTIKGFRNYGAEGVVHDKKFYEQNFWEKDDLRAMYGTDFEETVHIDLRMVDVSDFVIAFCPTNTYSVGTVHEIVVARQQHKPTLLVSPPISFDMFPGLAGIPEETKKLLKTYGLKENKRGLPSQWYGNIVGGHNFFDGFGFENMNIKDENFYAKLVDSVLESARPDPSDSAKMEKWQKVCRWAKNFEPLTQLTGGILDHVEYEKGEKSLLAQSMKNPEEQKRLYYWYNSPYMPKHPLLYHLFSIAAGVMPAKISFVEQVDANGEKSKKAQEKLDDDWLLLSQEDVD